MLVVDAAESDASVKRLNLVAATSLVVDVGAEVDTTDGSGLNGGVLGAAFEDLDVFGGEGSDGPEKGQHKGCGGSE